MSEIIPVHTNEAPEAVGPYSQAVKAGGFLYCSGQIPLNPKTMMVVEGGIEAQSEQVFQNLMGVLAGVGLEASRVVKANCYLTNMGDFAAFNEVYSKYFGKTKPARACVEVSRLPKDVLVEVELIALL